MAGNGFMHDSSELRKLIAENPELPIIVCAGENANTGEWGWEYCSKMYCEVAEVLDFDLPFGEGHIYDDWDEFEEKLREYMEDHTPKSDLATMTGEEFDLLVKKKLATYEPYWKKVILINVDN